MILSQIKYLELNTLYRWESKYILLRNAKHNISNKQDN